MTRRRAIVVGAICLVVVGIGLWFATMPYPVDVWWRGCFSVHYSDQWPIAESDFAAAMRLVKPQLHWREIITSVTVPGPDEITIRTTSEWRHALSGGGQVFVVRKKVGGEWAIAEWGRWCM